MPTIVFDKNMNFNRELLLERFKENNIDSRVFFYPLSIMPMFQERRNNIISYDIYERSINLPSYHDMSDDDITRVINAVFEIIR